MASLAPQISEAGSAALGSDVWVTVWFWMDAIGSGPFQYGQLTIVPVVRNAVMGIRSSVRNASSSGSS